MAGGAEDSPPANAVTNITSSTTQQTTPPIFIGRAERRRPSFAATRNPWMTAIAWPHGTSRGNRTPSCSTIETGQAGLQVADELTTS